MYIKSIIIDGFKSYGQRTEIKGFDTEFNAITGQNGSGKSNILDSICFVLGISNLTHVRAGNLQDLVYMRGHAGVTKASVTITFDNRDASRSPLGYERFEEITVTRQVVASGGKNKYMINGSTVQNKKVMDLFNSVQLNVNNPHFLIMQGRITKVLNMKPAEILSMVEESAGTGMYETKKIAAEKTMEKKNTKLQELDTLINEELGPKLANLHAERGQYQELQKIKRELEHQYKICNAWRFMKIEETCCKTEENMEQVKNEIEETKLKVSQGKVKAKQKEDEIAELQKKRDAESGGKLEAVEKELKEAEKLESKTASQLKTIVNNISAELKKKKQIENNVKDEEKALAAKKTELGKVEGLFSKLKTADQQDSEALAAAQRKFQAVSAGLITSDQGEDATLQDQLMNTKQEISRCQTESQQCEMSMAHSRTELKKKQAEMKKTESEYTKNKKELDNKERELASLEASLAKLNYEDGTLENLQEEKMKLGMKISTLQQAVDRVESRNPQLRLRYKDPEPHFNRASVHGPLCKLFRIKDLRYARALEAAAGGRLYNVVVDNENTSRKLIKSGDLERRVTFVPLNKIVAHSLDKRTVQLAQNLVGSDKVFPSLSLIEFRQEHRRAMEFAFGQTFVTVDMDAAVAVTYNKQILKKCITLSGDTVDPHGTLSGGAAPHGNCVLAELAELIATREELDQLTQALASVDSQIKAISKVAETYADAKQRLVLRQHEVEMVRRRLQQTTHHKCEQEVQDLLASIEEQTQLVAVCKAKEKECLNRVKEIEVKLSNVQEVREQELKKAEAEMQRLKKKAEASREMWSKREMEFDSLNLEIQDLTTSIGSRLEQIQAAEQAVVQLKQESSGMEEQLSKIKTEVKELQGRVKEQKGIISHQNKEIQKASDEKSAIEKAVKELELEFIRLDHDVLKIQADVKDAAAKMAEMLKRYDWIETDRPFFGKPRGMYDFKENDPQEAAKKVSKLEERKEKLGHTANSKALKLIDKEEEQYQLALEKRELVIRDRKLIESMIKELDEKKKKALHAAWKKVTTEFSSIFSSLLPGAQAKLSPPEGKTILDGLEVKVGFGGVWKDSLGELSGGQRSLVALSLILAMLLFKPAPIYILDEVDAALDLSHTQNIGQMLKAHFKHSQFIIVSLKDGMYKNANVLFQTKFVDGMSVVTRTAT